MLIDTRNVLDIEVYSMYPVILVLGENSLFNNYIVDRIKDFCKPSKTEYNISMFEEFGIKLDESLGNNSNVVDFDTFMEVSGTQCMNGTWFCKTELSLLTKKQFERFENYCKKGSQAGRLVIESNDFSDYIKLLKSTKYRNSTRVGMFSTKYIPRKALIDMVRAKFSEKGVTLDNDGCEVFVSRLSVAYDEYEDNINRIAELYSGKYISASEMVTAMKGIENFAISDFIGMVLKPMKDDTVRRLKVYRTAEYLIEEYGANRLRRQLIKQVKEFMRFRVLINNGIIPYGIKYSMKDVEKTLGQDDPLMKYNEYRFKRNADTAASTSIKDWTCMLMILESADKRRDVTSEYAIYKLINRSVLSESRIKNTMGMSNIIDRQIEQLDNMKFGGNSDDCKYLVK